MSDVKVSVIIPVYNSGDAIINSLNSAITQNLKEMEIICINDGSTDNSQDIIEEYSKRDSRLKLITQENSGAGEARNKGLETAKGEYILFLDSDDWIEENTCELLYCLAKKSDAELVLFDSLIHNDENIKELKFLDENFKEEIFGRSEIKDKVFDSYLGVIWNKFYKSSFLRENNIKFPSYKIFNDVEFHVKTMTLARKITYTDNIFYHYNNTQHFSLQKAHVGSKHSLIFCDVIRDIEEFLKSENLINEMKSHFLNYSLMEFKIKLYHIDKKYKAEYFSKIKEISESIDVGNEINDENLLFYEKIMNSNTFEEFSDID